MAQGSFIKPKIKTKGPNQGRPPIYTHTYIYSKLENWNSCPGWVGNDPHETDSWVTVEPLVACQIQWINRPPSSSRRRPRSGTELSALLRRRRCSLPHLSLAPPNSRLLLSSPSLPSLSSIPIVSQTLLSSTLSSLWFVSGALDFGLGTPVLVLVLPLMLTLQ